MGTLDPMATGVLPLAVGPATRLIPFLDDDGKTYMATMTLGATSDTQDAWGRIEPTGRTEFDRDKLELILKVFTGNIRQIPPMYSAVHHQGRRLYQWAREGVEVERAEREVRIFSLTLLDLIDGNGRPQVKIEVDCSRGTYVRTLCHDIGARLGTGAYLSELTRIRAGVFTLEDSYRLEQLEMNRDQLERFMLALDYPLAHMPAITLSEPGQGRIISHGGSLPWPQCLHPDMIRVYSPPGELLALARCEQGETGLILKPVRVFK